MKEGTMIRKQSWLAVTIFAVSLTVPAAAQVKFAWSGGTPSLAAGLAATAYQNSTFTQHPPTVAQPSLKYDTTWNEWVTLVPQAYGLVANDGNRGAARYRFEFSASPEFTDPIVIELDRGQAPALQSYPQLRPTQTYFVRVLVKQAAPDPWSAPGPVSTIAVEPSC
jgi:hypothetical protein